MAGKVHNSGKLRRLNGDAKGDAIFVALIQRIVEDETNLFYLVFWNREPSEKKGSAVKEWIKFESNCTVTAYPTYDDKVQNVIALMASSKVHTLIADNLSTMQNWCEHISLAIETIRSGNVPAKQPTENYDMNKEDIMLKQFDEAFNVSKGRSFFSLFRPLNKGMARSDSGASSSSSRSRNSEVFGSCPNLLEQSNHDCYYTYADTPRPRSKVLSPRQPKPESKPEIKPIPAPRKKGADNQHNVPTYPEPSRQYTPTKFNPSIQQYPVQDTDEANPTEYEIVKNRSQSESIRRINTSVEDETRRSNTISTATIQRNALPFIHELDKRQLQKESENEYEDVTGKESIYDNVNPDANDMMYQPFDYATDGGKRVLTILGTPIELPDASETSVRKETICITFGDFEIILKDNRKR